MLLYILKIYLKLYIVVYDLNINQCKAFLKKQVFNLPTLYLALFFFSSPLCGDVLSRQNMGILRIFFLLPQTSLGDNHFKELPRACCPLSEPLQTSCCSGSILHAGGSVRKGSLTSAFSVVRLQ